MGLVINPITGLLDRVNKVIVIYDAVVDINGGGDFTDIESAIDDGAKSIFVRDGTYTLSEAIDVDQSGIEITGETREGVIINGGSGAYDAFVVTATGFSISNLTIDSVGDDQIGISTSTASITMDIDRIIFDNCDSAVVISGDSVTTTISNCTITANYPVALGVFRIQNFGGSSCITRISNCDIAIDANSLDVGVKVGTGLLGGTDGGQMYITNCIFTVDAGIGVEPTVTTMPTLISGCTFNVSGNNTAVKMSAVGKVTECYFNQTGAAAASGQAINLETRHSEVLNNTIEAGFFNGIRSISTECRIMGNRIESCENDGILLTGTGSDNNVIMGNVLLANIGFGLNIDASTQVGNIVVGNVFDTNTAGSISDSGTGTQIGHNVIV